MQMYDERTIGRRTKLMIISLVIILAVVAVTFGSVLAAQPSNPTATEVITVSEDNSIVPIEPSVEQNLASGNLIVLGLDEEAWTDAYSAASGLEKSAQQIMNAVFQIRKGSVENVEFNIDQLNALKDQGLGGMVKAVDRYQDLLGILKVNQSTIDTWESTHPQNSQCYIQYLGVDCPPLPTPTP